MERLRRRVDAIVEEPATAEVLKPYYRYQCKRPASNDEYYPTFNRPNVTLVDVSATRGVERLTEKGFVANGREYEIDCLIFASGYEVTSDLDRRWGFERFEGRGGYSMYDNWSGQYRTFHGVMTHRFPNLFVIGLNQGGLNSSLTVNFEEQGRHIAHIIGEVGRRGATTVEPTAEAQANYVRHIRETAIDNTQWVRECTPGYFNNEGQPDVDENGNEKFRFYLGDIYGPGWDAFMKLLQDWRDQGDLEGLVLGPDAADRAREA
jgi:cyclohexanone monooxygenase